MEKFFYEHILNASGIGYWEVQFPSLKVNHNLIHAEILGRKSLSNDLSFEKFLTFVFLEDLQKVRLSFDELNNQGKTFYLEYRIVRPDGTIRWLWSSGFQLKDDAGKVTALVFLERDITEEHLVRSKLESIQEIYNQFFRNINLAFYQLSTDFKKITFLNNQVEVISGKTPKDFYWISQWIDLVVTQDKEKVKKYYLDHKNTNNEHFSIQYRIEGKDGKIHHVLDRFFVTNDESKKLVGVLGVISDLTDVDLKRRIDSLLVDVGNIFCKNYPIQAAAYQVLKSVCSTFDWPAASLWLLDEKKEKIYRVSAYSEKTLGDIKSGKEFEDNLLSNSALFSNLFKNSDIEYFRNEKSFWNKEYPTCVVGKFFDNEIPLGFFSLFLNEETNLPPVIVEFLKYLTNYFNMYLQKKFVEDQYFISANYDSNTGLLNNRMMVSSLSSLISTQGAETITVVKVLVDQIDKINQAFDFDVSNKLLKKLAEFFLKSPDESLHLISSFEENGFVFLFKNLKNINSINAVVQKILNVKKESFFVNENHIPLTVSIGVSVYPKDGRNERTLLNSAKSAVIKAHKSGGDRVVYATEAIRNELFHEVSVEFTLYRALENNEFILHYQPKVDLKTGSVVGCEALIRWQEPDGPLRMPGYFIDIAESSDLIIQIGEWVFREVCRQMSEDPFGVPVAVNLSVRQLKNQKYFFDFINRVMAEYSIDPKMLEFEVTESIIIYGDDIINGFLKFREMGIKVSFDDFGTKYCSLAYLNKYVPDRIKIDKAFVDGVPKSETNIAIIKSIVELAKSLHVLLTVEGAESLEQVKFFIDLACDDLQSYYISKPVPVAELKKLLNINYKSTFV